jgi:hypothetical protein
VILLTQPECRKDCEATLSRLMQRMAEPVRLEGEP